MRGAPVGRAAVVFVVLLGLGWPLSRLTREAGALEAGVETTQALEKGAADRNAGKEEKEGEGKRTGVAQGEGRAVARLECEMLVSRAVAFAEMRHLGKVVWRREKPQQQEVFALEVPFPKEGIELGIRMEAVEAGVLAVRLRVRGPSGEQWERSVWGEQTLEEIVPLP